jgi:hypothetical protein
MVVTPELVEARQQQLRAEVVRAGRTRPHAMREAVRRLRHRTGA